MLSSKSKDGLSTFDRVQLNWPPCYLHHAAVPARLAEILPIEKELILQVGDKPELGIAMARSLRAQGVNCSILFDKSGGRGISPATWPIPPPDVPCGYAGGLGPDNLEVELRRLQALTGEATVWVDMQSKLRTVDQSRLDLDKVRLCLEIVQSYIE